MKTNAHTPTVVRVVRRFDSPPERLYSPPERVFDAWLNPEIARKFMFATPTG